MIFFGALLVASVYDMRVYIRSCEPKGHILMYRPERLRVAACTPDLFAVYYNTLYLVTLGCVSFSVVWVVALLPDIVTHLCTLQMTLAFACILSNTGNRVWLFQLCYCIDNYAVWWYRYMCDYICCAYILGVQCEKRLNRTGQFHVAIHFADQNEVTCPHAYCLWGWEHPRCFESSCSSVICCRHIYGRDVSIHCTASLRNSRFESEPVRCTSAKNGQVWPTYESDVYF